MNKVMIIGNVTRDPELKSTQSGMSVCTFNVAVSRKLTQEQKQAGAQGADFFNVVAWRGTADACAKYLSKGKKVAVSGRLQTRSYDAADGSKRHVTEIVAEEVEFLSPREDSGYTPYSEADIEPVGSDEALPF